MERQVGRILLQRTRPPQPTASGEILLRMARQIAALEREAIDQLGLATGPAEIPLVINADSLATWAMPALAPLATDGRIILDIHREDEAHPTAPPHGRAPGRERGGQEG